MLIVTTEPCGCSPWSEEHHHPDCPMVKQRKESDAKIDEKLQEFRREVEQ
jgi:hypothetical protein